MLFNSYIFICIFLPICLVGWYGLNYFKLYRLAGVFLSCMSLWFYAYFNVSYLAIILVSICINYVISYLVGYIKKNIYSKIIMILSISINLGILFYFKYFDFFIENVNLITGSNFELRGILLPLGISFFTFQQLSFVIDRCLGKAEHYDFIDYCTFVTFFPQLIAGPIVLYDEMMPQFLDVKNRHLDKNNLEIGIKLFVIGLSKKVLLADILAIPVKVAFSNTDNWDTMTTIIVMLLYAFELYFDFSGYCDMALGLARMFNIILPLNFNSPYKSVTVKEFWQRWHITLSRFFINYVYIPLGGSRRGFGRMLVNVFIIFTLSGLWHGAAWTYVAWGAINGLLVVWDNLCIVGVKGVEYKKKCKIYIPRWLGWFCTFSLFLLTLCFFRSSSITEAVGIIRHIIYPSWNGKVFEIVAKLSAPEVYILDEAVGLLNIEAGVYYLHLVIAILLLVLCFYIISRPNALEISEKKGNESKSAFYIALLFVWCVISLSQVSTFLYFNF